MVLSSSDDPEGSGGEAARAYPLSRREEIRQAMPDKLHKADRSTTSSVSPLADNPAEDIKRPRGQRRPLIEESNQPTLRAYPEDPASVFMRLISFFKCRGRDGDVTFEVALAQEYSQACASLGLLVSPRL